MQLIFHITGYNRERNIKIKDRQSCFLDNQIMCALMSEEYLISPVNISLAVTDMSVLLHFYQYAPDRRKYLGQEI